MNIAVFASHGGSGLQAIIDACKSKRINAKVCAVISNNSGSFALQRARNNNIPAYHFSQNTIEDPDTLDKTILDTLTKNDAQIIFLAGYLKKLGPTILKTFENRVFNIHPSLLPKYGGKGMYGLNVHAAVLAAKETETGITIHRVSDEYDSGEIIAQTKVPVEKMTHPSH
ncbi:MAG: phosphoribosylglycinamide formyltransferase [Defluviitaleaceae bacterium]|nr:phosphoribosylglycinamide formyltransferase [Defluviitaleaceae bacterium]